MQKVVLVSEDFEEIVMDEPIAKCSKLKKYMEQNINVDPADQRPISVPFVHSSTLHLVKEWAEKHMNDEHFEYNDTYEPCEWDHGFIDRLPAIRLANLVVAAHFLQINALSRLVCLKLNRLLR
ncbi:hypothetical protein KR215_010407, partial [Drosophila sulfurigaster]